MVKQSPPAGGWPKGSPERFRLPGDALELMKYKLESAEASLREALDRETLWKDRIRELEACKVPSFGMANEQLVLEAQRQAARIKELKQSLKDCMAYMYDERIKELEQEVERLKQTLADIAQGESCINCAVLEQDRDNWRAKAECK